MSVERKNLCTVIHSSMHITIRVGDQGKLHVLLEIENIISMYQNTDIITKQQICLINRFWPYYIIFNELNKLNPCRFAFVSVIADRFIPGLLGLNSHVDYHKEINAIYLTCHVEKDFSTETTV